MTPVLFLIFNRPSTTKVVFEEIRKAKPGKLYIAADGPRKDKPGEFEKCAEARATATSVDWDCDVKILFRDENLGCGKGVSSGISWFFENESEGIILEDDCVPNQTFFRYCAELLERYRDDKRVMEISGTNLRPDKFREREFSYSFSHHNGIWGWASWRRAWNLYDYEMRHYKTVISKGYLRGKFNSIFEEDYFLWVFKRTYLFPHITWDYQWEFVKRINSGITIIPEKNLVENIGFGEDATNTINVDSPSSGLKVEPLSFPLMHPTFMMVDFDGDKYAFIEHMTTTKSRTRSIIKRLLPAAAKTKLFQISMKRFIASQENNFDVLKRLNEKGTLIVLSFTDVLFRVSEFVGDLKMDPFLFV